jgi:toxin YoeB
MYRIVFTEQAQKDLKLLYKTGQVEPLKGYDGSVYSRRITREHRLVYKVYDDVVEVLILSTFGHYR